MSASYSSRNVLCQGRRILLANTTVRSIGSNIGQAVVGAPKGSKSREPRCVRRRRKLHRLRWRSLMTLLWPRPRVYSVAERIDNADAYPILLPTVWNVRLRSTSMVKYHVRPSWRIGWRGSLFDMVEVDISFQRGVVRNIHSSDFSFLWVGGGAYIRSDLASTRNGGAYRRSTRYLR